MKKLLFFAALLSVVTACKKETSVEADILTEDTATVTVSESVVLPEYTTAQVSDLIQTKNDTLYVTNFFATWCGPCIRELPHFKKKMEELEGQPVKWTYINLDQKSDWETKVKPFGEKYGISNNIVLLDLETLTPDFFRNNFKQWDGASIPYTMMHQGDKVDETVGMMTEEELNRKLSTFKLSAVPAPTTKDSGEKVHDSEVKNNVKEPETV